MHLLRQKRQEGVRALLGSQPCREHRLWGDPMAAGAWTRPSQAGTKALLAHLPLLAPLGSATSCQDKTTAVPQANKPGHRSHAADLGITLLTVERRDTRVHSFSLTTAPPALRRVFLPDLERDEDLPALWLTPSATAGEKRGGKPLMRTLQARGAEALLFPVVRGPNCNVCELLFSQLIFLQKSC